ncbi:MAG TPA: hypothetical protein PLZ06_01525 [Clostridia bacterium]|jgi:hypothetical protein|nr:hypothetical protein [Clostridia bacterium]HQC67598.1 hypothetical protein [Clostridia bacterium]
METVEQMSKENLLIVLKYREQRIKELEKEIQLYQRIIKELTEKNAENEKK